MHRTRNAACLQGHRGFKSHPLRHFVLTLRQLSRKSLAFFVKLPLACGLPEIEIHAGIAPGTRWGIAGTL